MSYDAVAKETGISKWTLIYRFSPNRKLSMQKNTKNYRETNPLVSKIATFYRGNRRSSVRPKVVKFTVQQLKDKIGSEPRCYLTGERIDISKPETYSLDHIVAVSKGGESSLANCGLVTSEVNYAKQDLSVDEFIALCERVVKHNPH